MGPALLHDHHGATAVEFALLLPVLLAVLAGGLELGRALWLRQTLQFAVEEAARHALVEPGLSAAAIDQWAAGRMGAAGVDGGTVQWRTSMDADGVTVSASVDFVTLMPGILPAGAVSLSAASRMPR